MKKITALFVVVIYAISIIMVAFLGVQAEISNRTVEVTSIVLKEAEDANPGDQYFFPSGTNKSSCIYQLDVRPKEEEIDEETGKKGTLTWNDSSGNRMDYIITIWNFNRVADDTSWRDGLMHFNIGAMVEPHDATKKDLTYTILDSGGVTPDNASIDNLGVITFKEKFAVTVTNFYIHILPTDNSTATCLVQVRVTKYKAQ